ASQATATAASAASAWTSTSAIREPASGASRIVAGPRTVIDQLAGVMNVALSTVVCGVFVVSRSLAGAAASGLLAAGVGAGATARGALGAAGGGDSWHARHATRETRVAKARIS